MTRLDAAADRLEQAVRRLERLTLNGRNMLPAEDAGMREALDALRGDYRALREITQAVRGRLDATIERLEGLLEH